MPGDALEIQTPVEHKRFPGQNKEKSDERSFWSILPWVLCAVFLVTAIVLAVFVIIDSEDDCDELSSDSADAAADAAGTTDGDNCDTSNIVCEQSQEGKDKELFTYVDEVMKYWSGWYYHPWARNISSLQARTDAAREFNIRLKEKNIDITKLSLYEQKVRAQLEWFLNTTYANPYGEEFYSGTWLLGPDKWCWQPMCWQTWSMQDIYWKLFGQLEEGTSTLDDVLYELDLLIAVWGDEVQILKYGVEAGFVRSDKGCAAAFAGVKDAYSNTARDGINGTRDDFYYDLLVWGISSKFPNMTADWEGGDFWAEVDARYEAVGEELVKYFDFYENTYMRFCPPTEIVTGLAQLPVDYVYVDGVVDTSGLCTWCTYGDDGKSLTTKLLPGTNIELNGTIAYFESLKYFLTGVDDVDMLRKLGEERLDHYYSIALGIAKNYTGLEDEDAAIAKFKETLWDQSSFFNDAPFPPEEWSNITENVERCSNLEKAKENCPKRYEAVMEWFSMARAVTAEAIPLTVDMFHYGGKHRSTPSCPVDMQADFNPYSGAQSYQTADYACSRTGKYNVPFWMDNLGPIWSEYGINIHEAVPGHHTQTQGKVELFTDPGCTDGINALAYHAFFGEYVEGWGLYSEDPLLPEMGLLEGNDLQTYGWVNSLLLRSLRLILDTGFHYYGLKHQDGLDGFEKYLWDTTDMAEKETVRYAQEPAQALTYMWGRMFIYNLREELMERLDGSWNLQDFHFQIMSLDGSPLSHINVHMHRWADCVEDNEAYADCDAIFNPIFGSPDSDAAGNAIKNKRDKYPQGKFKMGRF